ncbi:Mediator of RNA polymerase II transcription subunita [Sesamum angolense]|uniref:Mediator of RNA polymerase II transcription subunita n=1 Tax=Sesamum angolense TaxID=2727404 RepID=A0AAE1X410_9LAMI|nr:Mediator of RNA polymerase II transcription subunita [Sesamum angolense]
MDEGSGRSAADIEEWMKELLPDHDDVAGILLDSHNSSVRQSMASSFSPLFEEFSQTQTSGNMAPNFHQQQLLQKQMVERPNIYQLPMQSNTYLSNIRPHQPTEQQASLGFQSTSPMMIKHQESFNVRQHADQTSLQKSLEAQSGLGSERMHPKFQMSAYHQQSQNLTLADQFKPGNQSQAMHLGPSQESTPQVELTNSTDWVNPAFQKILLMKQMYLPEVITLSNRAREARQRATNTETVIRCEKARIFTEKTFKFLNMSRSDLLHWQKEKLYQIMNDVIRHFGRGRAGNSLPVKQTQQVDASGNHLEAAAQMQQRESYLQFNSTPANLHQSLRQGGALSLPATSVNSFKVGSSSVGNSCQYSTMRLNQQWGQHGSTVLPHKSTQVGSDHRPLRMLLHPTDGVAQNNNMGTQQTVASSRNMLNSLDYAVSAIAEQNKQQDQAIKRQKMKQPVPQMFQRRNEDTNLRRFVGFNQRWSPLPPSSSSPFAMSPQNSQQSSSQLELKELSSKLSRSATPSLSASPSAPLPSPLTPLTPSSVPADSMRSPLSLEESSKLPKVSAAPSQLPSQETNQNQLVIDTQGLSKSSLQAESTCTGDQKSEGDPFRRLVEVVCSVFITYLSQHCIGLLFLVPFFCFDLLLSMRNFSLDAPLRGGVLQTHKDNFGPLKVKSISSRALHASLRDINAVTSLTDRITGHLLHDESTKVVFHDLADDLSNCDDGDFSPIDGTSKKKRMERRLDSMTLNDLTTETEFFPQTKRLEKEPNDLLLQEIKEINQKLIEVVVEIINTEDVSRTGSDEATLIRCSYIPVGHSWNIKIPNTAMPNLLLELIVSADYPNSSPTVLETIPPGCSDAEEGKYLWMKAKSRFSLSLRKFSQPILLKEMAEAWDFCAREVFHGFAEQMGGVASNLQMLALFMFVPNDTSQRFHTVQ